MVLKSRCFTISHGLYKPDEACIVLITNHELKYQPVGNHENSQYQRV